MKAESVFELIRFYFLIALDYKQGGQSRACYLGFCQSIHIPAVFVSSRCSTPRLQRAPREYPQYCPRTEQKPADETPWSISPGTLIGRGKMTSKSTRPGRPSSAGSKQPSQRTDCPAGSQSCMLRVGERLMRAGSEGNLHVVTPKHAQRKPQEEGPQQPGAATPKGPLASQWIKHRGPTRSALIVSIRYIPPLVITFSFSNVDFISWRCSKSRRWRRGPPACKLYWFQTRATLQLGLFGQRVNTSHTVCDANVGHSGNNNSRQSSAEDLERLHRQQNLVNQIHYTDPRSPGTAPRRYTIGGQGPSSSRDPLTMQHAEIERKKEVFLEHLKKRYPHHAAVIMGHQEHLREHTRSPQHSASPQPVVGVQKKHLSVTSLESLEAMSEGEGPASFTRGSRARASLPVARSANQSKDRSTGVLYLQYAEETKQVRMPDEIMTGDSIRALFVSAFPHQLNVKMLESPNIAVYIKDDSRNMYYELTDVRNIKSRCCLKVYHKDPEHAFNRSSARPINTDGRIPREMLYGNHNPVHTLQSTRSPVQAVQRTMSPPTARSMPSSPSRIPFGSRVGGAVPGSATLPRAGMSSGPPGRSITLCPSAILERRDVRPDEDLGGKSMATGRPDGSYALQEEGQMRVAPSQGESHAGDVVDMGGAGVHRTKSIASYVESQEHQRQHSLYKQKSRRYGESQGLPPLGMKTPPPSPHKLNDNPVGVEWAGPGRRSLRRESNSNTLEVGNRTRGSISSVSSSPVFMESSPGHHGDGQFQGHISPSDPQTRQRMKAMEQQIASLAGLVQHALAIGPAEIDGRSVSRSHVNNNAGGLSVPPAKSPSLLADGVSQAPPPDPTLQVTLTTVRRNVTDLRQQLHQLRQLQMQNQDSVMLMLRRAEQELSLVMSESRRRQESEPDRRHRFMVDEERHKYLTMEDRVLVQLRELEDNVDRLTRNSGSSAPGQLSVSLRDVEEGAVNLRRVGEALARLKGEFPGLQGKMRAVLRVEVEAVRFLKEEPQKMDSMLKRVKALTESLSALRRCVTENHPLPPGPGAANAAGVDVGAKPANARSDLKEKNLPIMESPKPQPRSSLRSSQPQGQGLAPNAPIVAHCAKQPRQHHPSPPLTPTYGRDSPTVAKVSPRSRENSPAQRKRGLPRCEDALCSSVTATPPSGTEDIHKYRDGIQHRLMDMEVAERAGDLEEERPLRSSATAAGSEVEQILQEASAGLMRAIPDLQAPPPPLAPDQPSLPDHVPDPDIPLPDEVDGPQPAEVLTEPAQWGNVSTEAPVQASPELNRPLVGKPRRHSVEREKNSSEKAGKSPPPPPPPRRLFPSLAGPGLTTGRSGEVIFTSRTEVAHAKDNAEKVGGHPNPKTTRQPPEVKPKPHTAPVTTASTQPEKEEDEEQDDDEDDAFMKELQVFQKYTLSDVGTKCVVDLTSAASQVRQIEPEFSLSANRLKESQNHQETTDENRLDNDTNSPRVLYYVTGQISNEKLPSGITDQLEGGMSLLQVAKTNTPQSEILIADGSTPNSCNSLTEIQDRPPNPQKIGVRNDCVEILLDENNFQDPVQYNVMAESVCPVEKKVQPVSSKGPEGLVSALPLSPVGSVADSRNQQVVSGSRGSRAPLCVVDEGALSPDLPDEEGPPPPENIGFMMISSNRVQALSTKEYQEIVSRNNGSKAKTIKVGSDSAGLHQEEHHGTDREPVIIVFDEPMDIQSAYKRMSTIFECEEELEWMLHQKSINEDAEEAEENNVIRVKRYADRRSSNRTETSANGHSPTPAVTEQQQTTADCPSQEESKTESSKGGKPDTKKKFKFKFPKNKLAAISLALRSGTKTGKKTVQVVVCEEEEDGQGERVEPAKASKRFEINSSGKPRSDSGPATTVENVTSPSTSKRSKSKRRSEEICKNAYESINNLEDTIKHLEITVDNMSPGKCPTECGGESASVVKQKGEREGSPPKRSAPSQISKSLKCSQSKKSKPQPPLLPKPSTKSSSKKQNSSVSPSSRTSLTALPKSRQQPAGCAEKPEGNTLKLQDGQKRHRQTF
ncbi:hypothetical protein DPEC_G00064590 [Dallia pectoralis]|uniref:Uncharacterized protein n=1 Tax=Dallia pectoralis TaxID=75939 RepID=A0ACC2H7Q0_DALPE|nr:hypothetical protein DPEC_G00064590 [Dallia pectoralis]